MRVALINPDWAYKLLYTHGLYPPYGVLMVATQLAEAGHEVRLIDANALSLDDAALKAEVEAFEPDVLGITVFTDGLSFVERFGPWWAERFPGRPLVLGGPLVSGAPETLLEAGRARVAVVGEGFVSVPALFSALERGEAPGEVPGLVLRGDDGACVATGPTPTAPDLDALPRPDWDHLPVERYLAGGPNPYFRKRRLRRYLSIITTLGCRWHCTFCQVPRLFPGVRARSPASVADEVASTRDRYGVESMYFRDDVLFRPGRIADALAERVPGLPWSCLLRADMVTEPLLRRMRDGGCAEVRIGFESGDDTVLDRARKEAAVADNLRCVEVCREVGVGLSGFLIVGLPGETAASLAATERFLLETGVRASVHFPLPLPGTDLFEEGRRAGHIPDVAALLRRFSEPQLPGAVLQPPAVNYTDLPEEALVEWATRIAEAGRGGEAS